MRLGGFVAISVAMLVVGMACTLLLLGTDVNRQVDVVAANEVVKIVERHWPNVEEGDYGGIGLVFSVVDSEGERVYDNHPDADASINEALRNRSTVIDVTVMHDIVGKVLIHNDFEAAIHTMKRRLVTAIAVVFAIVTAFFILYTVYMHRRIVKPFKQLEHFARHIARGNLDMPLHMMKNNPFGAFTESFDMMREQLAAARKSEYEANRSKKELVAGLSHDIQTPVSSIKAISELMLLRAEDEKTVKQLQTIYAKSEQIHLLVTDMFHATLEELNELSVVLSEHVSTVLTEMIESVNIDGRIRCGEIPACMLLMDRNRLQQVIDNVVNNAYKYAGTAVTVQARLHGEYMELHIADEGGGMKEDEIPLAFHKFFRGSNAERHGGSGLGLYISKHFMNRMQGDIACFNHEGGFTVVLHIKLA